MAGGLPGEAAHEEVSGEGAPWPAGADGFPSQRAGPRQPNEEKARRAAGLWRRRTRRRKKQQRHSWRREVQRQSRGCAVDGYGWEEEREGGGMGKKVW